MRGGSKGVAATPSGDIENTHGVRKRRGALGDQRPEHAASGVDRGLGRMMLE
jgi:hypothetical protein